MRHFMNLCDHIQKIIINSLEGATVIVSDPNCDNTHLEAIVVSEEFEQMPLVKQHKTVMNILKPCFANELHALKLKTYPLSKWQAINGGNS